MAYLREYYNKQVKKDLMKSLKLKNINQIPKVEKIVISMGLGKALLDKNILEEASKDISIICGQKPVITSAKKSVSNFKLRKGSKIGLKVTLRGNRMYEFMERFFSVSVPRIRDFRGFNPDSFDGYGNYNLGINEHTIFPEIEVDKIKYSFGMNITFVTKSINDKHAYALLEKLGLPFKK